MKNIVIIIIDALRPKNLSLFGYPKETDKNLKEIAKQGIFFKRHFSTSNCTIPSLTSLFTAKYPVNNGIIHQQFLDNEIEKLKKIKFWFPSYLQKKGYETISIDWVSLWFRKGFNNYEEKERTKYGKLKEIRFIHEIKAKIPNSIYKIGKKFKKKSNPLFYFSASQTIDLAISKIKKTKKPFFLFMRFFDTHEPFSTTKYKASKKNEIHKILHNINNLHQRNYVKKRFSNLELSSLEDINNKYDLSIINVDEQIGRLHKFLKQQNLWKDTIFIVHSDHGWRLNERNLYFSNCGAYDDTFQVPLIMNLPGFKGKEIDELVQNVDIIPTILDYLGEKKEKNLDGKSLIPLIKKGKKVRDKVFLFDAVSKDVKAVRTNKTKFVLAKDASCLICKSQHHREKEEYDLEKDPEESKNIYSRTSKLMKFLK